jgi:hypothetical protein
MNPQDPGHPLSGALDAWERVVEDMEATAAEYREDGWETIECRPGDVTPLPAPSTDEIPPADEADGSPGADRDPVDAGDEDDRYGLDALLPGDEFRAVSEAVADATFDEYEVFRADRGDVAFLVVAMLARDARRAVLVPLYYAHGRATEMARRAREAAEMRVVVRPLSDDERVIFTQVDPEPLLPGAADADVPTEGATADAGPASEDEEGSADGAHGPDGPNGGTNEG